MHRAWLLPVFALLSIVPVKAGGLPLTTKEVSLMLRGGDSSAMVMQELSKRHFVGPLNLESETALVKAGAKPELIAALRSGTYSLPPDQSAKAQEKIADIDKRRAAEADQARKLETTRQGQVAQQRTSAAGKPKLDPNATADYLKGYLVKLNHGSLVAADDEAVSKKKLIAYYFSAHWCGPCRKFTPQLVDYYNRVAPQHPEFEIVFVSSDKTAADMEKYMREMNMPWPAIAYDKRNDKQEIIKAAGNGIPSLVLVESTGVMISSSFDGSKYLGTQKVLDDLDKIFGGAAPGQIAQLTPN